MGGAFLPAPLGALAEVLQGEGLNAVEIAELMWLACQLQREGGSPAVARRSKPQVGEPAGGAEEDAPMPEPQRDRAPEADSDQASGAQPTPPPRREPAAELQPRPPSGDPRAEGETDTLPVLVEDPPLISQPLRLARALSPLNRLVDAPGELELDEEATVEAIARAGVERLPWQPVLRPRREPWLELALVFDRSPSMAIWARLEKDLGRLFSRHLRLRDVRRFHLRHGPRGLRLTTPGGRRLPPEALLRADRRQLVVLVSDACAPAWFDGTLVRQFFGVWGKTLPTVLLQVFPEWMWERTALGGQQALAATATAAAATPLASQALELRRLPLRRSSPALPPAPGTTTVPVLKLDADRLAAWARLPVGAPGGIALAYRFLPAAPAFALPEPAAAPAPAAGGELEQSLAIFLAHASPAAQRLLGLLSCAPLITLPIARLVQREMQRSERRDTPPAAASVQLAEVLLSGLLVLVHEPEGQERSDDGDDLAFSAADTLVYGFATPELRERLLALVSLGQARYVVDRVESAVAASLGRSVDAFRALLCAPADARLIPGAALLETYARVSTPVLRRLGGVWAKFAERVETAWAEAERRSRQAEEERLRKTAEQGLLLCTEEVFHFSVGRLQWIEALPPLPGQRKKSPRVRGFLEPLNPSLDLQLVEIPAGLFLMGSSPSEEGHSEDEGPRYVVTLESFFLGRAPITQAQWREVAGWVEGPGERWGLDLSGRLEP
ncbi:MAG: SAV_2336 N-terminal domain-related protein, partial [Cyanobacteriota bacterium]|nr:SAV_2336 N-terminal domain-related protein [Cyanobacteriota bacterium]